MFWQDTASLHELPFSTLERELITGKEGTWREHKDIISHATDNTEFPQETTVECVDLGSLVNSQWWLIKKTKQTAKL